jgi:hypothetical protein
MMSRMKYVHTSLFRMGAALLLALSTVSVQAGHRCAEARSGAPRSKAKVTLAAPEEAWYDVTHVRIDLAMTPVSTAISGNAITTGRVVVPSMNVYAFELDPALTIDSFRWSPQGLFAR